MVEQIFNLILIKNMYQIFQVMDRLHQVVLLQVVVLRVEVIQNYKKQELWWNYSRPNNCNNNGQNQPSTFRLYGVQPNVGTTINNIIYRDNYGNHNSLTFNKQVQHLVIMHGVSLKQQTH